MFSGQVILQAVVSGLMLGGMFALIALGLTIIWGVMKIINFAHGEFLMLGLYLAFFLVSSAHFPAYLTILVTVPGIALMGVIIFRVTIKPMLKDPVMNQILLTLGLSLVLSNLALAVFKADVRQVQTSVATHTMNLGGAVVGLPELICFLSAIVVTLLVWFFMRTTDRGRCIRATAQNPKAAMMMGINVPLTYLFAFGLGSAIVGLTASLMLPYFYVTPTTGLFLGLIAFIVVTLGGMGNLLGCFLGGLIMGLGETLGAAFFPGSLSRVFSFGVFVLLLIWRPQGILTRRPA